MSAHNQDSDRHLLELIADLQDGQLSEEKSEELSALLEASSEARKTYRAFMDLHAQLESLPVEELLSGVVNDDSLSGSMDDDLPSAKIAQLSPSIAKKKRTKSDLVKWFTSAAAIYVISMISVYWLTANNTSTPSSSLENHFSTSIQEVAILTQTVEVIWENPDAVNYSVGHALPKGLFNLKEGLAQLEFFNGATVIIEGPTVIELISPERARVVSGKLRAFVPEMAQGFTIEGPKFDAVDLGTEFVMSIDEDGSSEVFVIDGKVDLHNKGGEKFKSLQSGAGVKNGHDADVFQPMEQLQQNFIGRREMVEFSKHQTENNAMLWAAHRRRWAEDPHTLVYFDFEDHQPWDRQLNGAGYSHSNDAAIIGADWSEGRWYKKGALEFKTVNDRVRLNIPEPLEAITLMIHIRLDGISNWRNSFLMSDEFKSQQIHWQLHESGRIKFQIKGICDHLSEETIKPSDIGRWSYFTAVCDIKEKRSWLYLNGELIDSCKTQKSLPFSVGRAEICNWKNSKRITNMSVRSTNGHVDEFLILKRALSADEIKSFCSLGALSEDKNK
ncbi:MAG: hypothetical protein HQL32_13955 [Planctomycetes bacterium]|nr:hypothetical protein [Planctomycetota bacterium]